MGNIKHKLLVASRPADLINHVIMTLGKTGQFYLSYCGSEFSAPDGTWSQIIEGDSVQRARVCPKCLERMRILSLPIPDDTIPQWRESPYGLA
jgi:hypothetical protein